jgi:hypothetical protein
MHESGNLSPELEELFEQDAGAGHENITYKDCAISVLPDFEWDYQLRAIESLLWRNAKDETSLSEEIKQNELRGSRSERDDDKLCDLLKYSDYQGIAHSMAAVGMIAPFLESVFHQGFQGIRKEFYSSAVSTGLPQHKRTEDFLVSFWDCHKVAGAEDDLVKGILALADAVGLTSYLPGDSRPTLKALFIYRNKMFHNGFEWPAKQRRDFKKQVRDNKWDGWFSYPEKEDAPAMFFMTDAFIKHCLAFTRQVVDGFNRYDYSWRKASS